MKIMALTKMTQNTFSNLCNKITFQIWRIKMNKGINYFLTNKMRTILTRNNVIILF